MIDSVDAARFPRVAAYLRQLPQGFESYPDCQVKAALFRSALTAVPLPKLESGALPEPLLRLVANPPRLNEWIPEVAMMAYNMAFADAASMSDEQFLAKILEVNRKSFSGPVYSMLLGLASPSLLIAAGGARWRTMHRGSALAIERSSPNGTDARLTFPPRLFTRLMLEDFARAIQAALEASRAKAPKVELVSAGDSCGEYRASW